VNVIFDVFSFMGNAINQAHEPTATASAAPIVRVVGSAYLGEIRVVVRERTSEASSHSVRRATVGSTIAARRAGR